jgi:hypothetical protein
MIKRVSGVMTLKTGNIYHTVCTLPCHDKMQSKTEGILIAAFGNVRATYHVY